VVRSGPFDDGDRERLVEAARLAGIGRLVPSVAHQLSTPLAAISLRAESLGAIRLVHHEAMRRQVKVKDRLAESLVPVSGEETHLGQVVVALLLNAVAASPDGGVVTVETIAEGEAVTVAVTDQGPGVPASVEERLFEPFVSSRPPPGGVGLGLMACQAIAGAHGGAISRGPAAGGGTRFALTLPRRPGSGP
jgi:signal transduction histidine kinase